MYKKFKILLMLSFLIASCNKMPVANDKEFVSTNHMEKSIEVSVSGNTPEVEKSLNEIESSEEISKGENIETDEIKAPTGKTIELGDMLKNSNMSYYAVDLDSGEVLADYRGENIATPASVMKIVTSATALDILGEETKLETKLLYDGKIDKSGVLNGNLYIKGSGDPTLGSENFKGDREKFLKDWVSDTKKAGIKSIKGNIIVLDDLFGYDGVSGKWLLEDLASGYGQSVYGISVFDNVCTIFLDSDSKGGKVVKVVPKVPNLTFVNNLKISPKGRNDVYVRGLPFENKRTLVGEIPANQKNIVVKSDIPDPGMFLGEYFKERLTDAGISVNGKVETARTTQKRPKNPVVIGVAESKTIGEMINVLLVESDNHYAEHLYQLMKLKGVDIKEYWEEKGIDTSALGIFDGSGLSRADYISGKTLTDILVYMYHNYPEYVGFLPKAGYEGTVVGFLTAERFDGEARVKSGSMGGVQSYAGYMEKDGKKVAFTIMINHWNGSRNQVKREIEDLLNKLF